MPNRRSNYADKKKSGRRISKSRISIITEDTKTEYIRATTARSGSGIAQTISSSRLSGFSRSF